MKWSRNLSGRWMKACYLCKGYVDEEIRSSVGSFLERCYSCTNTNCGAVFQLFLSHPRGKRKHGAFACSVIAPGTALQDAMRMFLHDELYANCPVCDAALIDRGDGILVCSGDNCGVTTEFYLEKLPLSFVVLIVIARVPEPGFSMLLSRHLGHRQYN